MIMNIYLLYLRITIRELSIADNYLIIIMVNRIIIMQYSNIDININLY